MTSTGRHFFVFLFILVSVLGFAGKALALQFVSGGADVNPKVIVLPTGGYTEDEDVTVWFTCENLWWYVGYYLDTIPPSNVLSNPDDNGTTAANQTMIPIIERATKLLPDRCGAVKEVSLGRLAVGWHYIYFFMWDWEGWGAFRLRVFSYFPGYFEVCVKEVFDTCTAESLPNTCGQTASRTGVVNCNGSCTAYTPSIPSNPSYYQQSCNLTSAANVCGQTTTSSVGSYDCDGNCVGTAPATPPVTVPPTTPSVSAPSSVPAWNEDGYRIDATSAACNDTDVTQYFEFSRDGVNWTGDNPGFRPNSWATLP